MASAMPQILYLDNFTLYKISSSSDVIAGYDATINAALEAVVKLTPIFSIEK
ncbi:hypothetical protein D3C77_745520 [compost metagenome]